MSDRILVMREGRQMAIFDRDEANPGRGADRGHGPAQQSRPARRNPGRAA